MSKFWRNKVLLFKLETAYGTDPAPTGADNAVLALDLSLSPMEGNDAERNLERPYFSANPTIPVDLHAKITFKVELSGSGAAGTAPAWGPLMRACATAQTIAANSSVTYNPISTNMESGTFHLFYDGIRHRLRGARGTFKLMIEASGIPYIEFTFTGRFEAASDVVNPTPTLSAFKAPITANSENTPSFTIDGDVMNLRRLSFDAGIQVEPRFLIKPGGDDILITDRSETLEVEIEAVNMSDFNPYSLAQSASELPVIIKHGTQAGNKITLSVPKAQLQRPSSINNQQNIAEWPLRFIAQPSAGNDQWTLKIE